MPDKENSKEKPRLYETKFSFGSTSAIITNLALIAGIDTWANAKWSIIGGILVIALADNISDSMGIHVYQESECLNQKEVWFSTFTNFFARLFVSLTFVLWILLLPLKAAVICSIVWGLLLLAVLTYIICKDQRKNPISAVCEHLAIAVTIIFLSNFVGQWISHKF